MPKPYHKPELISYSHMDVGVYSVSNVNAHCVSDCAATVCSFVADPLTGCENCDVGAAECGPPDPGC